eukprot:NODE_2335_length_1445_cov_220.610439_g2218_i0.p1 GENE.NODE_2335_length_1445_cov_220.610439_g2218_i0~~NODE_2335_length_1445_cov_220.610439_g2218_i0.p1  ORF type:complete len:451 (+),score=52.96 NODE_2335_length_1445_cov_220.610439_g2218_i0:56-1354(+)
MMRCSVLVYALVASLAVATEHHPHSTKGTIDPRHIKHTRSGRPAAFEGCGTWQEDYIALHRGILSGTRPPRYLVSISVEAGLADRLTGITTEFLIALLTNRAFQITTYDTLPPFEDAFAAPFINWHHREDRPELVDLLKYTYRGERGYDENNRTYGPEIDTSLYWAEYHINRGYPLDSCNVTEWPTNHSDVQTLFISSNRGMVYKMLHNPHHRAQFFNMGLRPETVMPCIWKFLFAPRRVVQDLMAKEFHTLEYGRNPMVLKIAVTIRAGDHSFDPEADLTNTLDKFSTWFDCAQSIENFARAPNQRVIWYVTSDSLTVRKLALARWGDKILTNNDTVYIHGDCGATDDPRKSTGGCDRKNRGLSIQYSVGQLYALAMCDYHIHRINSGYGRFGAWISGRWRNMYSMNVEEHGCHHDNYDTLEWSSATWAGI